MFIAAIIEAAPKFPRRFTVVDAAHAHAAVLSALTKADQVAGSSLHNPSRHKVFSCAVLPSSPSVVLIRVVFHSKAGLGFYHSLINALGSSMSLRLGSTICDVQSIGITHSEWAGVASWTDLLEGPASQRIVLRFATPTAIMKTDGSNQRYSSLFPEPSDVFLGLQRRWAALGGPDLTPELANSLNDAGCIIACHQLQTTAFQAPERLQIGFYGSVTYQLRNTNPEFVRAMCALARLAQFTGVGYQTTRGMGLVSARIEP